MSGMDDFYFLYIVGDSGHPIKARPAPPRPCRARRPCLCVVRLALCGAARRCVARRGAARSAAALPQAGRVCPVAHGVGASADESRRARRLPQAGDDATVIYVARTALRSRVALH